MEKELMVEVYYLDRGTFKSRKFFTYPEQRAWSIYRVTLEKLEREAVSALVCIRDGATDTLLRSERVGPVQVAEVIKPKGMKRRF